MGHAGLSRVAARTAAEVCERFPIGDNAKVLLREGMSPRELLDALIGKEEFPDAVRFLAHALPKREAVWWACRAAQAAAGAEAPAAVAEAVRAAECWVNDPSETNRRATMPAAEAAEFRTPAGCAAAAAFWSGGSLGPPGVPVIPPGENLTAHGVAGAVMLAAVAGAPEAIPENYRTLLAQGIRIAEGQDLWAQPNLTPAPTEPAARQPTPANLRQPIQWE